MMIIITHSACMSYIYRVNLEIPTAIFRQMKRITNICTYMYMYIFILIKLTSHTLAYIKLCVIIRMVVCGHRQFHSNVFPKKSCIESVFLLFSFIIRLHNIESKHLKNIIKKQRRIH